MTEAAYRKQFKSLDKSGDGNLDAMEIKGLIKGLAPQITDAQIAEYVTKIGGSDQKVSFEEFYDVFKKMDIKKLSPEAFEAEFKKLDKNGDGFIDATEAEIMLSNREGYTAEKAAMDIKKFDKNGDGKVNFDEFVTYMKG